MPPFELPEGYQSLDDAALTALADAARAEGVAISAQETFSTADADRLDVLSLGIDAIDAELAVRAEQDAALAARLEAGKAKFAVAPVVEVAPVVAEVIEVVVDEPVIAAVEVAPVVRPTARQIVANAPAPVIPAGANPQRAIIAAAGVNGVKAGSTVTLMDVVPAAMANWKSYIGVDHAAPAPLYQIQLPALPDALTVKGHPSAEQMSEIIRLATDESRLVGANGETGLIAAGGWCAPAPQEFNICVLAAFDGELDLPTIGMPRGSLSYFRHLDYSNVAAQLASGFACYTPTQLEVMPALTKPCVEIDCPTPVTAELDACSLCIRAGILQRKAFPEYIAAWMDLAMIAYRHFLNQRKIGQLVALIAADSGATVTIPATFGSISALLSAIRLAAVDLRAFHGMAEDRTLEIVLPYWIHDVLVVDHSRRQFEGDDGYTLASWTAELNDIGVRAQYVKDWAGQDGGFGGATPATTWPGSVDFLIYPAGAYILAREDIINVGTLQDSTLLTINREQLLFLETGNQVIAACGTGRHYTVAICPSGATAGPIATTPGAETCASIDAVTLVPSAGLLAAGGQTVTMTGTNLQGVTAVTVGGTAATAVHMVNSHTVTFVTPAKAAGAYNVVVTSPLGTDTIVNGLTFV